VAQMKATVLLLPSGTLRIAGPPCQPDPLQLYASEHAVRDPQLLQLLHSSLKAPKKKAKKAPGAADPPPPATAAKVD